MNIHNPFKHDHPPPNPSKSTHETPPSVKTPKSSLAKDESHEQSLDTLLPTPQLHSALTLLLATITTQMRTDITAIFDPRFVHFSEETPISANPLEDKNLDLSAVDIEQADKARKERERIVDQLRKPEVQALKKAVLDFYDKWRERVLSRVGEVVNSKSEAKAQAKDVETKGDVK